MEINSLIQINGSFSGKKVLLLNPPGKFSYLRDYYCSSISKAGYYWPPIDLLVLSGLLSKSFHIHIIDAITQALNTEKCAAEIREIKPDAIIFLSSVQSCEEDFKFLKQIKNNEAMVIIGCGEIFLENPQRILEKNSFIDGAILDFTCPDVVEFIEAPERFSHILPQTPENEMGHFKYPPPLHAKFPLYRYRYPFTKSKPFTSILAAYGCPFHCDFCNSGRLGYKVRDINNILDELKSVTELGIKQIFFADMTFGADKNHAIQLCDAIFKKKIGITWNCFSRVDVIDEQLLTAMKKAGCRLIQFGIENIDQDMLKKYGKKISLSQIKKTFNLLKQNDIFIGAHFLFGLPDESLNSVRASINSIEELRPDYISLNIFSPRKLSSLSLEKSTPNANILNKYIRRAYLKYYLHPRYLLNRLSNMTSLYEFSNVFYMGRTLCRNLVMRRVQNS